jgi:hypothetical protein
MSVRFGRTCALQNGMSALPPKADICSALWQVRLVPIADIWSHSITSSVRAANPGCTSMLSRFAVFFEFAGLQHRQVGGFCTIEHTDDKVTRLSICLLNR